MWCVFRLMNWSCWNKDYLSIYLAWLAFVFMSQCGNNNELVLHGGFCTMWSSVAKNQLLSVKPRADPGVFLGGASPRALRNGVTDWSGKQILKSEDVISGMGWALPLKLPLDTVHFSVQIMSAGTDPSIFSGHMEAVVCITSRDFMTEMFRCFVSKPTNYVLYIW